MTEQRLTPVMKIALMSMCARGDRFFPYQAVLWTNRWEADTEWVPWFGERTMLALERRQLVKRVANCAQLTPEGWRVARRVVFSDFAIRHAQILGVEHTLLVSLGKMLLEHKRKHQ